MTRRALALLTLLAAVGCNLPDGSLPPATFVYGGLPHLVASSHNVVQIVVLAKDGAPVATAVQMVLDSSAQRIGMRLAPTAADTGRDSLTITSDARGLASVVIWTGGLAGHAVIHMRAPVIGLDHDMIFDFPAGVPNYVAINRITPVHPGDSTVVVWLALQTATGAHLYVYAAPTVDDTATATIGPGTYLKAAKTGFTWVRLTVGAAADSAPLAVVPHGSLGAVQNGAAFNEFDLTGTPVLWVLQPNNGFGSPRYSPSGDTLAFHQAGQIYLLLLNGLKPAVVPLGTLGLTAAIEPWWSADGQWIYFTGLHSNTQRDVWRIHPNATGAVRVGPAADTGQIDGSPSVDPAGTKLAIITSRMQVSGQWTLQVINTADSSLAWQGPTATAAAFSPDGAWIAFLSGGQLQLAHPDGTGLRTVLPSMTRFSGQLAWSHDSRYIAVAYGGGAMPLYLHLVDTQTDTDIRLPYAPNYTMPAWK